MNLGKVFKVSLLGAGVLCFGFVASAQVETKTQTSADGTPTKTVKIERGEVVYVSGNNLVVKAEDGTLRHFDNVPDSRTVTVDGQQLNVHQLKPGMKLERQTITTSVPKMITTIKTVTGTVWQVTPPTSVILTMENGKNQRFKIPNGQKFTVNGQETDAFGLRKGMRINAQQVIEQPETVIMTEVKRTGTMPPPPPPMQPDVPVLVLVVVPDTPVQTAAAAPTEAAPTKLPKTGTSLPLIGVLGALLMALGLGVKIVRTRNA
jgi:LPXTG-motif cell wall-anchored protein